MKLDRIITNQVSEVSEKLAAARASQAGASLSGSTRTGARTACPRVQVYVRADKLSALLASILLFVCVAIPARAQDDTNAPPAAPAPPKLDYNSFDLITSRNIFDPNRRVRSTAPERPPTRVDSFTLVGTLSSDKGRYAFFDSSSSSYRKTLKPSDTIAGYTIVDISTNSIKLAASSNQFITVSIGNQMRRRDGGPWALRVKGESGETETTTLPGVSPDMAARAATLNGSESDAFKRLMARRLQEK